MKDVFVCGGRLLCCHFKSMCVLTRLKSTVYSLVRAATLSRPNGGSAFASATQNTRKVATYVPSIASGTTFIVFSTTTNSTITDRDLGGFADEERAHRPLPICSRFAAEPEQCHDKTRGGADATANRRG